MLVKILVQQYVGMEESTLLKNEKMEEQQMVMAEAQSV